VGAVAPPKAAVEVAPFPVGDASLVVFDLAPVPALAVVYIAIASFLAASPPVLLLVPDRDPNHHYMQEQD